MFLWVEVCCVHEYGSSTFTCSHKVYYSGLPTRRTTKNRRGESSMQRNNTPRTSSPTNISLRIEMDVLKCIDFECTHRCGCHSSYKSVKASALDFKTKLNTNLGYFDPIYVILYNKINNFQGDITDKSVEKQTQKTKTLVKTSCYSLLTTGAPLNLEFHHACVLQCCLIRGFSEAFLQIFSNSHTLCN